MSVLGLLEELQWWQFMVSTWPLLHALLLVAFVCARDQRLIAGWVAGLGIVLAALPLLVTVVLYYWLGFFGGMRYSPPGVWGAVSFAVTAFVIFGVPGFIVVMWISLYRRGRARK